MAQAFDLASLDQKEIVGLHAGNQRQSEERIRVLRLFRQTSAGQAFGAMHGGGKLPFERRVRLFLNPAKQAFVIEEKFRGKHALAIELLEEIGSRLEGRPERLGRPRLLPFRKTLPRLIEFQLIRELKSGAQLRIAHDV